LLTSVTFNIVKEFEFFVATSIVSTEGTILRIVCLQTLTSSLPLPGMKIRPQTKNKKNKSEHFKIKKKFSIKFLK
jgi:hypothetical protein